MKLDRSFVPTPGVRKGNGGRFHIPRPPALGDVAPPQAMRRRDPCAAPFNRPRISDKTLAACCSRAERGHGPALLIIYAWQTLDGWGRD